MVGRVPLVALEGKGDKTPRVLQAAPNLTVGATIQ